MKDFTAEQLVILDESIFKLQTGWRCMAYGPIGQEVRWSQDVRRGATYSILPAYTDDGFLPCTGIKEGFYKSDEFYEWITTRLLLNCNKFPGPHSLSSWITSTFIWYIYSIVQVSEALTTFRIHALIKLLELTAASLNSYLLTRQIIVQSSSCFRC